MHARRDFFFPLEWDCLFPLPQTGTVLVERIPLCENCIIGASMLCLAANAQH